jgi:hypothetical protein
MLEWLLNEAGCFLLYLRNPVKACLCSPELAILPCGDLKTWGNAGEQAGEDPDSNHRRDGLKYTFQGQVVYFARLGSQYLLFG